MKKILAAFIFCLLPITALSEELPPLLYDCGMLTDLMVPKDFLKSHAMGGYSIDSDTKTKIVIYFLDDGRFMVIETWPDKYACVIIKGVNFHPMLLSGKRVDNDKKEPDGK